MLMGMGSPNCYLSDREAASLVQDALASLNLKDKRVLIIIPDGTRSMPMAMMAELFEAHLSSQVQALDYLVALGTHQPMSDAQLSKMLGKPVQDGVMGSSRVFNHLWNDPAMFTQIGTIPADKIRELTQGRLVEDVPVRLNRLIQLYDQIIICGPVFPHEVVGFSGGNKYFFPGIAGPEIINFTHWLGALMTSYQIIGSGYTPVRAVIDQAASLITTPVVCFSLVVTHAGLAGLYFGSAQEAWQAAADLSARVHIVTVEKPYQKVISIMPELYDDIWTAAKGMYKMEPVIADGGEVVIYAPHIREISYTHGAILDQIGYHCRDFFVKQWETYRQYPLGVLAHSTHLRGMGTYDAEAGRETPRIRVTLATGIPPERCNRVGLGYQDPATLNLREWMGREAEGILVVERAGEMLYRLRKTVDQTTGKSHEL